MNNFLALIDYDNKLETKFTKKYKNLYFSYESNNYLIKYDCYQKYLILFKGYLTNREHLKCKLKLLGYKLKDSSDLEIILNLYIHYKEEVLTYLKGSYTFFIYDGFNYFMASDRFNTINLYYVSNPNFFAISTSIKELIDSKLLEPNIDKEGVKALVTLMPMQMPREGIFTNLRLLKPGEYILINSNYKITKILYYNLENKIINDSYEEAKIKIKEILTNSINNIISSTNSNLSCYLSGGIDSSITTLLLSKHQKEINTYLVNYEGNEKNFEKNTYLTSIDNNYNKLVSDYLKTNNKIVNVSSKDLLSNLKECVRVRELPFMGDIDASLMILNREISKENRFILSGECSDEILLGYPWFYLDLEYDYFPWLHNCEEKANLVNDNYKYDALEYLKKCYYEAIKDYHKLTFLAPSEENVRVKNYLTIYYFMPQLIHRASELANMYNLTVFTPFLDEDLVEYCFNLPFNYKIKDQNEKYILKDIFKDELPKEVINRKKSPYPKTFDPNYYNLVKEEVLKIISKESFLTKIFDKERLTNYLNSNDNLKTTYYGQLISKTQFLSYLIELEYFSELYDVKLI